LYTQQNLHRKDFFSNISKKEKKLQKIYKIFIYNKVVLIYFGVAPPRLY